MQPCGSSSAPLTVTETRDSCEQGRDPRRQGTWGTVSLHSFNKLRMNDLNMCQGKWRYVSNNVSDRRQIVQSSWHSCRK